MGLFKNNSARKAIVKELQKSETQIKHSNEVRTALQTRPMI